MIRAKSRDYYWFSPLLRPILDGKRADIVYEPETREQLARIAAACARHRVKLTMRGGGTGNYGQAVPLEGGVVVDMTQLNRVISHAPGIGRFEAGARLLDIDRALRDGGWELRYFPSTRRQATIGGYVAGGAGGIGSCTWGQLADPGAVIAAQVLTVEEIPRIIELQGRDVLKVLHAYGINGILTEVEMPLAPQQPWAEFVVTFPSLLAAARFAYAFTAAEGIAKKLVSIHDERIPPLMGPLSEIVPAGHAMALLMVSEPQEPAMRAMATDYGGNVVFRRSAAEAEGVAFGASDPMPPLYEFSWNHTTLRAIRLNPAFTYLQVRFPAGDELRLLEEFKSNFDELIFHLEFQRRNGRVFVSSLPLLRFVSVEAFKTLSAAIERTGGQISDAHTFVLDDAGWKKTDAPQAEFKHTADPFGLMNPGKLAPIVPG
jgi:FAD/FMN-containing dehydrogenase